ncbi:competence/damage-inducible protein CinA [Thermaerobacter marianensis DSM 12885]|uniref:Putative competence-damage inducible protein n=1 Tax=Thermaerobacter marianensis (strain ATCC 700841 / DSM 12885 / JCM 10246 / 7p75a) TaxID=644966 RepID=E6SK33_THEM7|nr:competence/damage-inducible protein A [Thermaerobacter marianensis]ADU51174.1 competence/damage-inducible protein CinA [Thermaerobacter marianensis DSM 12885]
MNAEIVCVGTELLLGETVNTHAAFLFQRLAAYGIDVYHHVTVGDNPARLTAALEQAAGRAGIVIVTGGLGPTGDDLTREAIASVTGRPLVLDAAVLAGIEAYFAARGRPMAPGNRKQALFPEGSHILPNPHGTAPGFVLEWAAGRWFVALPGPPRELRPMVDGPLVPFLERWSAAAGGARLVRRVLRVAGLGESEVEHRLQDLFARQGRVTLATYAKDGEVHLRLAVKVVAAPGTVPGVAVPVPGAAAAGGQDAAAAPSAPAAAAGGAAPPAPAAALQELDDVEAEVRRRLGLYVYGRDEETLEEAVGRLLRQRGETVAVAESCTGGRVADRLTNVPGSSAYVMAAVVAYANQAKVQVLGVSPHDLTAHGAVSEPVARAMAAGVRRFFGTDWGVATTGIAGPGGGTPEKPVGTVYVAVDGPGGTRVERHRWLGDRHAVKTRSAQAALLLLYRALVETGTPQAGAGMVRA